MASEWDQFEDAPADFSGFQDAPAVSQPSEMPAVGSDFRIDKFRKLFAEPGNEVAIRSFVKNDLGLPESEWGKYAESYANKDGKTAFGLLLQDIQRADLGTQATQGAMAETATGAFPISAEAYRQGVGFPLSALANLADAGLYVGSMGAGQAIRGAGMMASAPVKRAVISNLVEGGIVGGGGELGVEAVGGEAVPMRALASAGGVIGGNILGSLTGALGRSIGDIPVTPQLYRQELSDAAIRSKLGGDGTQFLETAVKDRPAVGAEVGPALMESQGQAFNIGQEIVAKANEFDDQLFKEVESKLAGKRVNISDAVRAIENAKFTGENLLPSEESANKMLDAYARRLQGGYDLQAGLTGQPSRVDAQKAWELRKTLDANIDWDSQGIDRSVGARVNKALKEARRSIAGEMEREAGTGPDMKAWRTRIEAQDNLKDHLGSSLDSQEKRAEGFVSNLYGANKTKVQTDLEKFDTVFGTDYADRSLAAVSARKLGVFPVLGEKTTKFSDEVTRMDTDKGDVATLSSIVTNPTGNFARLIGGKTKNEMSPAYNVTKMRQLSDQLDFWQRHPNLAKMGVQPISSLAIGLGESVPWVTRNAGGAIYPTPTGEQ